MGLCVKTAFGNNFRPREVPKLENPHFHFSSEMRLDKIGPRTLRFVSSEILPLKYLSGVWRVLLENQMFDPFVF